MEKRKLLLSIMVVGMFGSAALALAPMGPPVAGLSQGEYNAGFGYAFSKMKLGVSGPVNPTTGEAVLVVRSNMYYGCLGYGISDDWNIYGAAGVADADFNGEGNGTNFDGNRQFGFAVGTKKTLAENGKTKWGVLAQYSRGKSEDNMIAGSGTTLANGAHSLSSGANDMELTWYAIQLALGPTCQVSDNVCVYGGPFLHLVEGDLDVHASRYEYELQQLWELGAYFGTMIYCPASNASFVAEILFTRETWGFGVGGVIPLP